LARAEKTQTSVCLIRNGSKLASRATFVACVGEFGSMIHIIFFPPRGEEVRKCGGRMKKKGTVCEASVANSVLDP
jgi:hypothetical protein